MTPDFNSGSDGRSDTKQLMAEAIAKLRRSHARIGELEDRLEAQRQSDSEPVSIIGISCRLPGNVESPDALWDLLRDGGDAIGPVPTDRWDPAEWRRQVPDEPGRFDVDQGGFVPDVAAFDAEHFRIPAREADYLDPQQRLLLETVWHACEDAGIAPSTLRGKRVGVFVGLSTVDYAYEMVEHLPVEDVTPAAGPGTAHSTAAGRISYLFGLLGPSLCIDTACSSSLVAMHLAVRSLQAGECDLAFVAGANAMLSPYTTLVFDRAGMLAPDGRCKGFDLRANGYGRAEGAACVLLERQGDAAHNSRRTRAVVRGSAVGQDGPSAGLTVPSRGAQERVIRAALEDAGLASEDVDAVEAHGTGTALGDPIEAAALGDVFGPGRTRPLFVASIKSNMGHLEAAAGVAGVLRAVLQLQHGTLAPQVHFEHPSEHIPWRDLPLSIPTGSTPWSGANRRIGVSSFGFSGTNAHVILECASGADRRHEAPSEPSTFALSARTPDLLRTLAGRWLDWLERHDDVDACAAAAASRRREAHALSASLRTASRDELTTWLRAVVEGVVEGDVEGAPGTEADDAPGSGVDGPPHPFERRHHWFPTGTRRVPGDATRGKVWQQVWVPVSAARQDRPEQGAVLAAAAAAPSATDLFSLLELVRAGEKHIRIQVPPGTAHDHLIALVRVLRMEEPDLDLRIQRGDTKDHLAAPGEDDLWVMADGTALAPRLRELTLSDAQWTAAEHGHYVVTGGRGELGRQLVGWLIARGARSIETLGRSSAGDLLTPDADIALRHTRLDVGNFEDVQRWASERPRIDAVFHLAGVLEDGLARDVTPADFETVAHAKAIGGHALYQAVADRDELEVFCSFSSAAAILGNPGQAVYAAANGALPTGPKTVRVAFGPWSGPGMAEEQGAARWRRRGVRPLAAQNALRSLGNLLADGVREAMVLDVDWNDLVRSLPTGQVPPLLSGLTAPSGEGATERRPLVDELPLIIETILGRPLRPGDQDHSLAELGLDSLMLVDVRQSVQIRCGVDLPMSTLTNPATTVRDLASQGPALPAAATPSDRDAALLTEIERLSDEEARRILGEDAEQEPRG